MNNQSENGSDPTGAKATSTIEDFARKLDDLYQRGKAEEPKTIRAGCQLPFHLHAEVKKLEALLSQYRVKIKKSALEIYVELSRGK